MPPAVPVARSLAHLLLLASSHLLFTASPGFAPPDAGLIPSGASAPFLALLPRFDFLEVFPCGCLRRALARPARGTARPSRHFRAGSPLPPLRWLLIVHFLHLTPPSSPGSPISSSLASSTASSALPRPLSSPSLRSHPHLRPTALPARPL